MNEKKVNIQLIDSIDIQKQLDSINLLDSSYMNKAEFIEMISKLNFDKIEECSIDVITGYKITPDVESPTGFRAKSIGYNIRIC